MIILKMTWVVSEHKKTVSRKSTMNPKNKRTEFYSIKGIVYL